MAKILIASNLDFFMRSMEVLKGGHKKDEAAFAGGNPGNDYYDLVLDSWLPTPISALTYTF